jgi:hypothetical protein
VLVRVADSPRMPKTDHSSGLERNRETIWRNDRRNDVVARVGLALAEGDLEAPRVHGLPFDEGADHGARSPVVRPGSRW